MNEMDETKAREYLIVAKDYIEGSLSRMRYDRNDAIGFLEGNPGIWAIAAVIYDALGNELLVYNYISHIQQVMYRPLTNQVDFDRGMAGFLYTIEFLEGYFLK